LKTKEAKSAVKLAELQEARAQIEVEHYQELIEGDISELESSSLDFMLASAVLQVEAAKASFIAAFLPNSVSATSITYSPQAAAAASRIASLAAASSTTASMLSTLASFERRRQEWEFQQKLAQQDVAIGAQQVTIANDHVEVVEQEKDIAEIQTTNAKDTVDF